MMKAYHAKYSDIIDKNLVNDLLEFNNFQLQYARQIGDMELLINELNYWNNLLSSKLNKDKQLAFAISELRIKWNCNIGWRKQLAEISHNLEHYINMSFPEKFNALKEIFRILEKLFWSKQLADFQNTWANVFSFMTSDVLENEINHYLDKLPNYCIKERCHWLKEKIFINRLKIPIGTNIKDEINSLHSHPTSYQDQANLNSNQASAIENYVNTTFKLFDEIIDIQLSHDNLLEAIETCLDRADEAMAQANQLVWLHDKCKDDVWKYTRKAISQLPAFAAHPQTIQFNLRIARYALYSEQADIAKRFFINFLNTGQSPYHYADWLQRYFMELQQYFQTVNATEQQ